MDPWRDVLRFWLAFAALVTVAVGVAAATFWLLDRLF